MVTLFARVLAAAPQPLGGRGVALIPAEGSQEPARQAGEDNAGQDAAREGAMAIPPQSARALPLGAVRSSAIQPHGVHLAPRRFLGNGQSH